MNHGQFTNGNMDIQLQMISEKKRTTVNKTKPNSLISLGVPQ